MEGRGRTPHRPRAPRARSGRVAGGLLLAGALVLAWVSAARAQDPARTATIYVHGFERSGADQHGTFGEDVGDALLDSIATLAGVAVVDGNAVLPPSVAAMTDYYGDTPPSYYTPADLAELDQVTAQWGGGVPRYALIVAKYAHDLMRRSGAQQVNFVSASFGSLIVRWLIEKNVGGLAGGGRIARWLSIEGLLAGNWAASRGKLVDIVDFVSPLPIDVDHMTYGWVETNVHTPRTEADHAFYAGILMGQAVSTDDGYENGALTALMRTSGEWQPNDGVQAAADALFQSVTTRSRFQGMPPTLGVFHCQHLAIQQARAAWAEAATFLTQRRRVTVTMTSARVTDLHEPEAWYWDWRPAEVVLESRVYSPEVEARWGIGDALCVREKEGAAAPLRRYGQDGESQSFTHVLFDDLVLAGEKELRLELHAEEIDYDWRYGVHETVQLPYYDDLGSGSIRVSTLSPGSYTFQAASWSCTLAVSIFDYAFAPPLGVVDAPPGRAALRISPNPLGASARITLEGAAAGTGSAAATLEIHDISGRRVRRIEGDALAGFRWDGRDQEGVRLPAGLYVVRLSTPRGTWSARSVLLP